jgi:protein-arginine kinase activator protein McsA
MKICSFCKKNFSNKKFREIKRKNWKGFYPVCKKCESISMKERYEKNPIPQMLSNAKIRAKQKSLNFNLTSEYLKKIFPKDNKCPITGVNFQFGYKNHDKKNKDFAPSLDKIIPEKGYVEGNVIVVLI